MAIRIRKIKGRVVALCAAEHTRKRGDIYLDDVVDHALRIKFLKDYREEGLIKTGAMAKKRYRLVFERTLTTAHVNVSEYALCLMPKLAGCSNVVAITNVFNDELRLLKRIAQDSNGRIEVKEGK